MANSRPKRKPSARIAAERLMWGDLIGASPPIRRMADEARAESDSGLGEDEVRRRIRARIHSEGLSTRAIFFPNLSRKLLRFPLRKLLRAVADLLADRAESKKLGGALQPFLDKIGFDQWLENYIWDYARTGEPSPVFECFTGQVVYHEVGPEGDRTPTVWLVATPASDTRALIREFEELCAKSFPDETLRKRFDESPDGARYLRIHEQQGLSYGEIARKELIERRPDLPEDSPEFREMLSMDTERITKAAARVYERADRIVNFRSAESD